MDLIARIARLDPTLADQLLRLLNEIELAQTERPHPAPLR